jgi:hypothetical protein
MNRIRDYLQDARWYARRAAVPVQNAAYRATEPLRSLRWNAGEYRRRWAREHGRRDPLRRAADHARSRLPLVRDRVNPATGRKHRDDAELGRRLDRSLKIMRDRAVQPGPDVQARDYAPAYKRNLPERRDPGARADAVLGPGRAARAEEALRQARHDPWAEQPQSRRTR